jgi:hypothetical protein
MLPQKPGEARRYSNDNNQYAFLGEGALYPGNKEMTSTPLQLSFSKLSNI